ncbi:guanine nucleotide exchange protein for ADP-robosylation factor [Tieghemiomyces parasiticus]|uniref:Guanine nucleotide exchange protein for ADP-robosylation factor n=1 Tax=Tieghemiomyces parasiticus TaxID=78921 RepID=A0A9W7ZV78_9FUNG|nr:guanine nucleotide exchange protein for ADP-robosylation factor [Tieghemiomyces parasiticus]
MADLQPVVGHDPPAAEATDVPLTPSDADSFHTSSSIPSRETDDLSAVSDDEPNTTTESKSRPHSPVALVASQDEQPVASTPAPESDATDPPAPAAREADSTDSPPSPAALDDEPTVETDPEVDDRRALTEPLPSPTAGVDDSSTTPAEPDTASEPAGDDQTPVDPITSDSPPVDGSASELARSASKPNTVDGGEVPADQTTAEARSGPEPRSQSTEADESTAPSTAATAAAALADGPTRPTRNTRTDSMSTVNTTFSTGTSSLASVQFFIVNDFERLLKTREGKRDKKLREALTQALEHLKGEAAGTGTGQAPADELFLTPLRLACATESTPVLIIALDCIEKLISYRFFETSTVRTPQSDVPPSPLGGEDAPGILDQLVDIVCDCFVSEITDDKVQLQVIKAILAAVSCVSPIPDHQLHQTALLKAVRTVYNIYLLSRSEANQTLAQGTMSQIVHLVFGRVVVVDPVRGRSDSGYFSPGVSAAPSPGLTEERTPMPPPPPPGNEQAVRDALSLFRALCKLSMKNMSNEHYADIRILSLRSRLLALHLIQIVLAAHLDVFTQVGVALRTGAGRIETASVDGGDGAPGVPVPRPTSADLEGRPSLPDVDRLAPPGDHGGDFVTIPFVGVVKEYLTLSLNRNLVSTDFGVFEVSLAILSRVLTSLRKYLRKEIEVLFREIILPTVEMRHAAYLQRSCLLQCLLQICHDPQALIEIYLNYDCAPDSNLNLYERLVNTCSKLASGSAISGTAGGTVAGQSAANGSNATSNARGGSGNQYILAASMFLPHTPGGAPGQATLPPPLTTTAVTAALTAHKEYLLPDDYSLKCQAVEALAAILRSLVTWINRGAEAQAALAAEVQQQQQPPAVGADRDDPTRPPSQASETNLRSRGSLGNLSSPSGGGTPVPVAAGGVNGSAQTDDPGQLRVIKQRKQQLADGVRLFNWKPKKGIQALLTSGLIPDRSPVTIAQFLRNTEGINKTMLGEYLGEGDAENIAIMHAFVDDISFVNLPFVTALRAFLQDFRLPGESQKIDRFMLKFAERYVEGNTETFANADTAYVLAYSVILLNTDLHNPQVKHRMTKLDFVKNNRGINDNVDLPEEYLNAIYDEIQRDEIVLKDEHDPLLTANGGGDSGGGASGTMGLTTALDVFRGRPTPYEAFASLSREMANKGEALIREILRTRSRLDIANELNLFYRASHIEHVRPMFETAWMPLLAGVSGPSQETDDPDIIRLCLESFRHAIHIAATFDLALERDAFVSTLAKFTVLADLMEMRPKNIEAIKALLDIAAVDGNNLNQSWLDVLTCVSQLERLQLISDGGHGHMPHTLLLPPAPDAAATAHTAVLANAQGTTAPGSPGADRGRPLPAAHPASQQQQGAATTAGQLGRTRSQDTFRRRSVLVAPRPKGRSNQINKSLQLADLSRLDAQSQSLVVAVDRIFTSSVKLSGAGIVEFVRALSIVSWEEIQNSTFGGEDRPRLYSLQKIVEISYYNMNRIRMEWSNVWAILGDHFNQVGCHPNVQVGFFALDSLRQLSVKFLEKEELAHFKFQKDFLRPFHFILENSPDVSVKDMVLRCLQHIVRSRSDQIRSGWKTILSVLSTAAREPSEPIVIMAFEILREVCRERFHELMTLGSFPDLILCLTEFCTSANHQRSSLQAIEMLYLCAKKLAGRLEDGDAPRPGPADTGPPGAALPLATIATTAPSSTPLPPNEDPVYRLWFPVFYAMYDIIMSCNDLEVRTKALNYLFEFLKSYGATFSFEFWSLILQDVVYPIFRDLKSPESGLRTGRQEDMTFWFSTTLIKALRNLIDLFTHYYATLAPTLDGVLELLGVCITQESETLAQIGTACFQELIEQNHTKFDAVAWRKVCQMFLTLFNTSVPHVLFELSGRSVPSSGPGAFRTLGGEGSAATNGASGARTQRKPSGTAPRGAADPQEEYRRITLQCKLQLRLIETVDELFHSNTVIYRAVESDHLFFILDCLDKSYQFARRFNADVQLRLALVESGFMTQVPSLLKQEVSSLQCSLALLYRMYADPTPERQLIGVEVEDRLVPLSRNVFLHFNRIDPHTAERHIQAWQPVVLTILENVLDMDKAQLRRQLRTLYPEIIRLLAYPRPPQLIALVQQLLIKVGEVYEVTVEET